MAGTAVSGKADFGDIYNRPDPRDYYTTLGSLGYVIPQHGADAFSRLLRHRTAGGEGVSPKVLDVCCSYGVGGALLKTDLRLQQLYAHYRDVTTSEANGHGLLPVDREFFAKHRRPDAPRVVGLDVAKNAIDYAVAAGLLDDGVSGNFEDSDPSPTVAALIADTQLVTTTGGIGYVTERTFERLLALMDTTPWVAAFCLRQYDYTPIAQLFERYGLQTEKSERTYHQRRFVGEAEQQWALSQVAARGLDTAGKETDGHYHAELFVSRPPDDVQACPLSQLL